MTATGSDPASGAAWVIEDIAQAPCVRCGATRPPERRRYCSELCSNRARGEKFRGDRRFDRPASGIFDRDASTDADYRVAGHDSRHMTAAQLRDSFERYEGEVEAMVAMRWADGGFAVYAGGKSEIESAMRAPTTKRKRVAKPIARQPISEKQRARNEAA